MSNVCDVPVIATVCQSVGEDASSLVSAPFEYVAHAMSSGAAVMFQGMWSVFNSTTLIDVAAPQYVSVYNVLFGVAIFVMLVFFCLQLITGLIHRDTSALGHAAVGLGKSVLGSFVVLAVTGLLLEITDQLSMGIVKATGNTLDGMGQRLALLGTSFTTIAFTAPGVAAIMTIFLAGLAIAGTAIVWFSLLIRKTLLLVAIVFAPIALAGLTWQTARGWFGRWAAFVGALIFSKLVLVVIFLVAINQTSSPITMDLASVSNPIAGVVLMLVAAFAPYLAYKFISFVGFDMYHAMSSEQEAKQALNRHVPVKSAATPGSAKSVLDGAGRSSRAATSEDSLAASPAPETQLALTTAPVADVPAAATETATTAAPPAGAAVVGAEAVKTAATAGPKAGSALGESAMGHADASQQVASPPATSSPPNPRPMPAPAPQVKPAPQPAQPSPAHERQNA